MSTALNYGQQAFEGIKAFRLPTDKEIAIFRPQANALRLQHSNRMISIPEIPVSHFMHCIRAAVALNAEFVPPHASGGAMYIRPLVYGSSAQLGLNPPEEYTFVVFVLPTGVYHGTHPIDALILEDFDRSAPRGCGSAKIGGNYAPVLRLSERARSEGFGITLHLDSRTRSEIDEFSTSGFIGVRDNARDKKEGKGEYTLVVPDSETVLKSVTSDAACEIALSFGWAVEKRSILYAELPEFIEVMAAGTAAALVPIKSITMRSKDDKFVYRDGSDEVGPVASKLLGALKGVQVGKVKDTFGWLDVVESPEKYGFRPTGEVKEVNGTYGSGKERSENVDQLPA